MTTSWPKSRKSEAPAFDESPPNALQLCRGLTNRRIARPAPFPKGGKGGRRT